MRKVTVVLAVASLVACAHAKKKDFDADESWRPAKPSLTAAEQDARERLARVAASALYFAYDQASLDEPELAKLRALAAAMKDVPSAHVVVQGRCDERGTEEYNLVLGQKRAENARRYLGAMGVDEARLDTVSLGETQAIPAGEAGEAVWSQDRRDDFVVRDPRDVNVAKSGS
jgi:peptidoglycan-associated lipoprotein